MKKFILSMFAGLVMGLFLGQQSMAGCLATVAQVKPANDKKAEAVKARDAGDLVTAAAKYQEAAALHPQEAYKAAYLLNAEGCLVGKWNPVSGYRFVASKAEANKVAAQGLLDQVKTLLAQVDSDGCDYDSGIVGIDKTWLGNAQDALNGVFH